jgi:RNA polymerase sigma factor (sigma-70 family)
VLRSIDATRLMLCLDKRERNVVYSLYWQGLSAKKLAENMRVTASRVSQIKSEILKKLRETIQ